MKGLSHPRTGLPALRRRAFSFANIEAATGELALVPATPSASPFATTQYGVLVPPRAEISGYPRPVLFHHFCSGRSASGLALYPATSSFWKSGISKWSEKPPPLSLQLFSSPIL